VCGLAQCGKDSHQWTVGFGMAQIVLTVAIPVAGFAFPDIRVGLPSLILGDQSGMGTLRHT